MAYTDDEGREGVYSGTVNSQRKPHGRGKIMYRDGSKYSGTWSEGTQVHGKTTKKTKSSSSSSKASDKSGKLDKGRPNTSAREGGGSGEKKAKKSSFRSTSDSPAPPSLSTRDNRLAPVDGRKVAKVATTAQLGKQPSFTGVPAKPRQQSPASPGGSAAKQTALASYKELFNKQSTIVKNMIFVDFYGDRGKPWV